MPPRGRHAPAPTAAPDAPRETLVRCFLWELAQALKESFTSRSTFNTRKKHSFSFNYARHVPLSTLQTAALEAFAPPTQRALAVLRQIIDRHGLPSNVVARLLHDHLKVQATSLEDIASKCAPWFLGALRETSGKLTIVLPKNADKKPARNAPDTLAALTYFDRYTRGWWKQEKHCTVVRPGVHHFEDYEYREWTESDVQFPLARRIMAAEEGLTPTIISQHLSMPRVPPKEEPHSLELVIRLLSSRRYGFAPTRAVVGTMIVPHDVSCCTFFQWMERHFDDSLESYSYLRVYDTFRRLNMDRHIPEVLTAEESALPPELCVRIGAIEAAEFERPYGSDFDDELMNHAAAASEPFKTCPVLGSRSALLRKALEAQANHDDDDYDFMTLDNQGTGQSPPKSVSIKFDCALADVLPSPEECRPTMGEIIANDMRYQYGWETEMEWNHSENQYDAMAVRRLPRLPNEQYPVISRVAAAPHNYV